MHCVYYNLEEVQPEDVRRVRARVPGDATVIVPADAVYGDGQASDVLPSWRDAAYRERLMQWFEPLIARAAEQRRLYRHGISLLEVVRYRLVFDLAPWEHRLWALQTIEQRWRPDTLLWVDQPQGRREDAAMRSLARAARASGIALQYAGRRPATSLWRELAQESGLKPWLKARRRRSARPFRAAEVAPASCVFAEYFPNSTKIVVPVAEQLTRRGIEVGWLAGREMVQDALLRQGVRSTLLEAAAPGAWSHRLTSRERADVARLVAEMPASWFSGSIEAPRLRWSGIRRLLTETLCRVLDEAVQWVEAYYHVFGRQQPGLVVSTTFSSIPGRAAALAARAHGVSAVYIQHGLIPGNSFYYHFCHSHMLMWGAFERGNLLRAGHAPTHVHAVGSTIYDGFIEAVGRRPARAFPGPGESMRVVYLPSLTGGSVLGEQMARVTLQTIAEVVHATPGAHLVVKPHPSDGTRVPEEVMRAFPAFEVRRDVSSQDVILDSDVVIIVASTTGFEACLAGRPLVIFNPTGIDAFVDFHKSGAALFVERRDDLAAALQRLQEDVSLRDALAEGRCRLIAERLSGGHGDTTERVADFLAAHLPD